jgi:hypothetical protein
MALASLYLVLVGLTTPAAAHDTSSGVRVRLPADIQAKLQARKASGLDSTRLGKTGTSGAASLKAARDEREKLLQSLPPQERARMEATLKDMERMEIDRDEAIRRKQQAPRFRE